MKTQIAPSTVRVLVLQAFQEMTGADADRQMEETILIRDGHYRGRSYRFGEWMALWMIDLGIVQFFDEQGELRRVAEIAPQREQRAA